MICTDGECGGECYRCLCAQLVLSNDELRAERDSLRQTVQCVEAVLGGEQWDARTAAEAADKALKQAIAAIAVQRERIRMLREACEIAAATPCRCTTGDNTGCVCPSCVCRRALNGKGDECGCT